MLEKVGSKGNQTFLHCWECKFIQPLWGTVWQFLIKLKIELPYDPAIPLLDEYTEKTWFDKYTHPSVHYNAVHNSLDMEPT